MNEFSGLVLIPGGKTGPLSVTNGEQVLENMGYPAGKSTVKGGANYFILYLFISIYFVLFCFILFCFVLLYFISFSCIQFLFFIFFNLGALLAQAGIILFNYLFTFISLVRQKPDFEHVTNVDDKSYNKNGTKESAENGEVENDIVDSGPEILGSMENISDTKESVKSFGKFSKEQISKTKSVYPMKPSFGKWF